MLVQPLKTHGGKGAFNGKLAKWIISMFPPHRNYVETHAGGLAVLLNKPSEGVAEVVNDLNWQLTNFWQVMRSEEKFSELVTILNATPFARFSFESARARLDGDLPPLELAFGPSAGVAASFFVKCRQSRQALGKDFATLTKGRLRGGMNEQVSAWLSAVDGLPEVHARLRRIVVENCNAKDLIRRMDCEGTVFYSDPPYFGDERTSGGEYGDFEMTFADHVELLRSFVGLKGWFFLSGYRCPLYDLFAAENGWVRHEFEIPNNAASGDSKQLKTECVWTNWKGSLV